MYATLAVGVVFLVSAVLVEFLIDKVKLLLYNDCVADSIDLFR